MSKCLVTGGLGFVGSHVQDYLINAGHEVTVLDNLSTGKMENLNPKAAFIKGDITDKVTCNILKPVDFVFHLAALARIQPSIENPISTHRVNVDGTLNILEYCRRTKAKIIFSSSSSIYEGDTLPTKEIAKKSPKSPYALQKLQCEQYIHMYGQLYDMDYTILRYFNVFGPRQILTGAYAAVVGIFLDQKSRGEPLTITNDGKQRRDFTFVGDVSQANLMAMKWPREIFNVGTGHNYSINDIAGFVGGERVYIGDRQGEARETLADNTKALKQGWQSTTDIKDWIEATA